MTLTPAQRQANLGWFGLFMGAWGRATADAISQVEAAVASYRAGLITAPTLDQRVAGLLGLPVPMEAA